MAEFTWQRLIDRSQDMGYVGVYEKPDTNTIKMLLDYYTDEPSVVEASEQLAGKRRAVLDGNGQQYQEYRQKDLAVFAPADDYYGSTKIGRAYTNSLFQRLPSTILNTIYKNTHVGIDMTSAFSTMLVNAFRDLDLPFFLDYVHSPEAVYAAFAEMGVGRGTVKKLVNGTICAWPAVFEDPSMGELAELGRMEMVGRMREDVGIMAAAVRDRYPGFFEMVRRKCEGEGKLAHVAGTALFYLASDMEHAVMRTVISYVMGGHSVTDMVWKYDGIIVPMAKISGRRHEEVVRELRDVVKTKLDLDVRFKVDDLAANAFGICISPEDRDPENGLDAYERWKVQFERRFAVVRNPPVFMMFGRGGKTWIDLKKEGFDHVTATENQEHLKRWKTDNTRREYEYRDFVPPPLDAGVGVLNLFKGLAAAELPEVHGHVDLGIYMRHVDILMGNRNGEHPDYSEYMHNLLAQKVQHPGSKWRVMPIILSAQGTGKDVWFDFISGLFGDTMCVKGNGISDFVEKKSGKLEGKVLCCFQEMGTRKADKECEEYLKTYITNVHMVLERKHVNETIVTNVVDFIGFSNKPDAVVTESDDRRFFIVKADGTYAQEDTYMLPLLAWFGDDRNKRAVYDFYMNRDVSSFNSSSARPKTEMQRAMKESQTGALEYFLRDALPIWKESWRLQDETVRESKRDYLVKDGCLRVNVAVVRDHWMEYAKTNNFQNHTSKDKMMRFFSKLMLETDLRADKFRSEGVRKLIERRVANSMRHFVFDHHGIDRYLAFMFNTDEEEEEPPPKRPRGELRARWNPRKVPRYQVLEAGEVVLESDDLEKINKELGEAYICPLRGILVHQRLGNKEIDISDIWSGDHKWARVEQKYPFYIRDRTV